MLRTIFDLILGKLIGVDNIPPEKRKEFRNKVLIYAHNLAVEMAEGFGKGMASELKDNS